MFISPWKFAKLQLQQQQQSNHKKTKNYRGRRTGFFFPLRFSAEKSQTKSRFNDLSGAVAAEFPGLMISMVASATPSGKKSHGKREIPKC